MKILLFYTPVANTAEAESLGEKAVRSKLAACANSFPIHSVFPWKGNIEKDGEVAVLLKTSTNHQDTLRQYLEEHHSYDVPAILCWEAEVNEAYGKWVEEETTPDQ